MPLARDFGRFLRWTGRTFFKGRRAVVSLSAILIYVVALTAGWIWLPAYRLDVLIAAGALAGLGFLFVGLMFVRSRLRFVEEQRAKGMQGLGLAVARTNAESQKLTYALTGDLNERLNTVARRLEQLSTGLTDLKQSAGQDTARRLDRLEGDVWLAIERVEDESKGLIKDATNRTQSTLDTILNRLQRSEVEVEGRQTKAIDQLTERLQGAETGTRDLRSELMAASQSGQETLAQRLLTIEAGAETLRAELIATNRSGHEALSLRVQNIEADAEALRTEITTAGRAGEDAITFAASRGEEIIGSLTLIERALRDEISNIRGEISESRRDGSAAIEAAKLAVAPALDRLGKLEPRLDSYEKKAAADLEALHTVLGDTRRQAADAATSMAKVVALDEQVSARLDRTERQITLQAETRLATTAELAALRGRVEQMTTQGTQARDDMMRISSELATAAERATSARDTAEGLSGSTWQRFGEFQARVSAMLDRSASESAEKLHALTEDLEIVKANRAQTPDTSGDAVQRIRAALQSDFDAAVQRIEAIAAQASAFRSEMEGLTQRVAGIDSDVQRRTEETAQSLQSLAETVEQSARVLQRFGGANAGIAQPYARYLAEDKLQRLEKHWARLFGLSMSRGALAQLAHQVCQAEERCTGGFSGPIETLMMRLLAMRALPKGDLDILEIGSQYGVGAGLMHGFPGTGHDKVRLTIIDPLDRTYGDTAEIAGVTINAGTLARNLATLGVQSGDWRLIQRRSTEHEALIEARDRRYDIIIIDGDHSVPGVAFDFEAYGPMIKPGGILIFDDYGSDQWPGVQPFVDDYVRPRSDWVWVGGEYRLGIMRRRVPGEEVPLDVPATNVSPLFAERR